uniref:Uncharacterized protein n=1 Tax=Rhizoctonia solani TaxID=456999 RepID=N0AD17_9AGAM|nr:hypothetical protein RSOL_m01620 [Rhizoctonia solani]AGK45470.1 hypothetical protein RSOL_m01620 [Rhizoctonia solani]
MDKDRSRLLVGGFHMNRPLKLFHVKINSRSELILPSVSTPPSTFSFCPAKWKSWLCLSIVRLRDWIP